MPLVATLIALPFAPDQIPAHWGADGTVDRWSGKGELFITPALTLGFAAVMTLAVRAVKERGPKLTTLLILLIPLVTFCTMHGMHIAAALGAAFGGGESGTSGGGVATGIDVASLSMAAVGIVLVILGFVCLKLPPNPWIGVRIPGVAEVPGGWKRMQRFGCATMVPAGILIAVVCLVGLHGMAASIFTLVVVFVLLLATIVYGCLIKARPDSKR